MRTSGHNKILPLLMVALAAVMLAGCDTSDNSDYYGPQVMYTNPSFGVANIPTSTSVSVLFNETLTVSSVTTTSFTLHTLVDGQIIPVTGTVSAGGNSALFMPDAPLTPYSTYVVTLQLIADRYGNAMEAVYSWYFTTGEAVNPLENFAMANIVAGQDEMYMASDNKGGAANAASMSSPLGLFVYNTTVYVADSANNRVLGFNGIPATNGVSADFVLGQPDLTSTGAGAEAIALNAPSSVAITNSESLVADSANNRVLIWNSAAMSNGLAADLVVGQPGFDNAAAGCSAYMLNSPAAAILTAGRLVVSDTDNNRVLIWNSVPGVSNTPADIVLGQQGFDGCPSGAAMGNSLSAPKGLATDGSRLLVADSGNNRVLIWNSFPIANGVSADVVLGQMDMTSSNTYVSAADMVSPEGLYLHGGRLLISDTGNNRVLLWERVPAADYTQADVVLGQSDFHHYMANDADQDGAMDAGPMAETLNAPVGVFGIGNQTMVTDTDNHRVLIYNSP